MTRQRFSRLEKTDLGTKLLSEIFGSVADDCRIKFTKIHQAVDRVHKVESLQDHLQAEYWGSAHNVSE